MAVYSSSVITTHCERLFFFFCVNKIPSLGHDCALFLGEVCLNTSQMLQKLSNDI